MMFEILAVCLSSFVETFIIFDFMNTLFRKKYQISYTVICFCLSMIMVVLNFSANMAINYGWTLVLFLILTVVLYKSEDRNIFVALFKFIILLLIFETLASYAIVWLLGTDKEFYFINVCISSIMIVLFYAIYKKYFMNANNASITNKELLLDIIVSIFCFANILFMSLLAYDHMPIYLTVFFLIDTIGFLFLEIYLIFVLNDHQIKNELKNKLNLITMQQNNSLKYYEDKLIELDETRKIIHDFKFHLSTMETLYQKEKYDIAKTYTAQLQKQMPVSKKYCNNEILQCMLYDMHSKCEKSDIHFEVIIDPRIDFATYQSIDLVTIYSNLLFNSYEACLEIENSRISLKIQIQNHSIFSILTNTSILVNKKGNHFISTKKRHSGVGIINVNRTVESLGGYVEFEHSDTEFKVKLLLPLSCEKVKK